MVAPGVSGCLRRWGTQGLSPDELGIESTFLQELFMGPLLERKEGQMVTQHSSELRALQRQSGSLSPKPVSLLGTL